MRSETTPSKSLKTNIPFLVILTLALSAVSAPLTVYADPQSVQEYDVKAAFLYNFAKFVEWPPTAFINPGDPLIIGVLGVDPFGNSLKGLEDKTVAGRKILIKRFTQVDELEKCHLLFISSSEKKNLHQILPAVKGWNVLTVGEMKGFAEAGGMINFTLIEKRVRFEVNLDAAQNAGLKISSQLLKVAKIVKEGA